MRFSRRQFIASAGCVVGGPFAHVGIAEGARRIDALFAPLPPRRHHPIDGPIVRVFPDFRALEQKYFAETRCYFFADFVKG